MHERGKLPDLKMVYKIETIAATCGLLHDLGNPPFGHAGEQAIQTWFIERDAISTANGLYEFRLLKEWEDGQLWMDLCQFEGNAQTLRLVTKLQVLSDEYGLNLTYATLSAACKYTAGSHESGNKGQSKQKLGYFVSERSLIEEIRMKTGTGDFRNPIAFLVEAADDMVYSVVDVEDGIKKGVLSWEDVKEIIQQKVNSNLPPEEQVSQEMFDKTVGEAERLIEQSPLNLNWSRRTRGELVSQYFRTLVLARATEAVADLFVDKHDDIMEGKFDEELLYKSKVASIYKVLKNGIGRKHIWNSKETLRLELLGRRVIHDLMNVFWYAQPSNKARTFPEKTYQLLSHNYRTIYEAARDRERHISDHARNIPELYWRALLLTDYVCGMTDSFALNLHRELHHG